MTAVNRAGYALGLRAIALSYTPHAANNDIVDKFIAALKTGNIKAGGWNTVTLKAEDIKELIVYTDKDTGRIIISAIPNKGQRQSFTYYPKAVDTGLKKIEANSFALGRDSSNVRDLQSLEIDIEKCDERLADNAVLRKYATEESIEVLRQLAIALRKENYQISPVSDPDAASLSQPLTAHEKELLEKNRQGKSVTLSLEDVRAKISTEKKELLKRQALLLEKVTSVRIPYN